MLQRKGLLYLLFVSVTLLQATSCSAMYYFSNLEFDVPYSWSAKTPEGTTDSFMIIGKTDSRPEKGFGIMLTKPFEVDADGQWFVAVVNQFTQNGMIRSGEIKTQRTAKGFLLYSQDLIQNATNKEVSRVLGFSNLKQGSVVILSSPTVPVPAEVDAAVSKFFNGMYYVPICDDINVEQRVQGSWSIFSGSGEYGRTISWTLRSDGRFRSSVFTSVNVSGSASHYRESAVSVTSYGSNADEGCYSINGNTLHLKFDDGTTATRTIKVYGDAGGDPQKYLRINGRLLYR